jgi:hypothetical protein
MIRGPDLCKLPILLALLAAPTFPFLRKSVIFMNPKGFNRPENASPAGIRPNKTVMAAVMVAVAIVVGMAAAVMIVRSGLCMTLFVPVAA